jgi:hypothetical protein
MPNFRHAKYDPLTIELDDPSLVSRPLIYFDPSTTAPTLQNVQAAANAAMASGAILVLQEGVYNFTSGGLLLDRGPDLNRNGVAGLAYTAAFIKGAGINKTIINVGANQKAIWFATPGNVGWFPRVEDLSIIGTGINSNSIGVQIGGRSAVRSDQHNQGFLKNVYIDNVTSGIILDDITTTELDNVTIPRAKYRIEFGYNVDIFLATNCFFNPDNGSIANQTCVITNGSNTITGLFASTLNQIQVGYAVCAPGRFPPGSYVGSINVGGGSVTVVDYNGVAVNATSAGTAVSFFIGRTFCYGRAANTNAGTLYPQEGSPFVSPYWVTQTGAVTQGRIGAGNHEIVNTIINQGEMIIDIPGNSHRNVKLSVYSEAMCMWMRFGQDSLNSGSGNINFQYSHFGQLQHIICPPIRVFCTTPAYSLGVFDCDTDSAPISYPIISAQTFAFGRNNLRWQRNFGIGTTLGYTIEVGEGNVNACRPLIRSSFFGNSPEVGDAIEVKNGGNWHFKGQDGMQINLATANVSMPNPLTFDLDMTGKLFTLYVRGFATRTITFGTYFKNVDGTNLGVVSSGATDTFAVLRFIWHYDEPTNATQFRLQSAVSWV